MNKDEYLHLSKTISWLLRHSAVREGIPIQDDGFVRVSDLLQHGQLRRASLDVIKHIVASDAKQRFTLKEERGVYLIKANQGHSLTSIDNPDLVQITNAAEVPAVIHGTYYQCWESIKKKGLSCMNRQHIHFAIGLPGNANVRSGIRQNCEIYIYINLQKALDDNIKFYKSINGVVLTPGNRSRILEAKYFEKVVDAKTGSLLSY